jgi:DNA-binding MurR/RpiR family transcriptional regulator
MNCLTRIRQRYPTLAASDKKLADFILAQPDQTRHLSSQQLAGEAGVSQSSVVKFAQKMGFKGFPALKLALSEALASAPIRSPYRCITRFAATIPCAWLAKS